VRPEQANSYAFLLRKHVTFDRVLLLALALFNAGRFIQGQQATNDSIVRQIGAIELRLTAAEAQTSTYVRKDVGEIWFQAIDKRLTNIESLLREQRGRR
jgi:hypothetical protein